MEAAGFSETVVSIEQTARHYVKDNHNIRINRRDNPKSHKRNFFHNSDLILLPLENR
jgi:hypothetical protein